ncbi:hypothetical protein E3N88_27062 [Mikania micrantha]|uniref:DUF4371 domain-containing protein n=1 Tax=Mikania micrantha TaxID=192012 RepID=A0A5N6MWB0_9ASTR|nr:hypothetical protein E3N88_27062 [Mikania micrantha]
MTAKMQVLMRKQKGSSAVCSSWQGIDDLIGEELGAPKRWEDVVGVDPNGEEPSGVELSVPKVEFFGTNGLVDVVDENGFAAGEDEAKGWLVSCVLFMSRPIPPEDSPKAMLVAPNGLLPNAQVDLPDVGLGQKLKEELVAPKAGVSEDTKVGVLEVLKAGAPKAGVLQAPKAGVLEAPKAGVLELKPELPNVKPVLPNVRVDVEPKAGAGEDPKSGVLEAPNAGVLDAPKAGVLDAPKAGVLEAPKAGVLEAPKAEVLEPKTEVPNAEPVLPNVGVEVEPKAGVLGAPNAGVLVAPKAGVVIAEMSFQTDLKVQWIQSHQMQASAQTQMNLQVKTILVQYLKIKLGRCKIVSLPPNEDEAPKAGLDEAPKAGTELPKAGEDEAPKTGEEAGVPNTPVDVPPKIELPVCDPKGDVLPNGFAENGLLFGLLFCPKTDGDPNGLLDDCPNAHLIHGIRQKVKLRNAPLLEAYQLTDAGHIGLDGQRRQPERERKPERPATRTGTTTQGNRQSARPARRQPEVCNDRQSSRQAHGRTQEALQILGALLMERFFKPKVKDGQSFSKTPEYVDLGTFPLDPADRKPLLSYNPNQRDEIRRAYLLRGSCQPRDIVFPQTMIGKDKRRFTDTLETIGTPSFKKQDSKQRHEYRLRLSTSMRVAKKLLNQGQAFRGHDESDESSNKGNFLEWLELIGEVNEEIGKVILRNAPGNNQMTSPKIQQDIIHCFAQEEQMVVVIRYVDKYGVVKERFIGLVHVMETSALTLKSGIDDLFGRHGLSVAKIIGQGYDGASNMSDLLNAVSLVSSTKRQLEELRMEGFHEFFNKVNLFCEKHELEVVNMNGEYINPKSPRRKTNITYRHYFEYDCFNAVLDMQIQEFGNSFNEVTSNLLVCLSSLSPCDNFRGFDIPKILRLSEMYPYDFSENDKRRLPVQLATYIDNLKADTRFANLDGLSSLVKLMVETKKHLSFTLLNRLLKLGLVLPVATSTVERFFSAMKKSYLRKCL